MVKYLFPPDYADDTETTLYTRAEVTNFNNIKSFAQNIPTNFKKTKYLS